MSENEPGDRVMTGNGEPSVAALDGSSGPAKLDADDEQVVPAALAGMVAAAKQASAAIAGNWPYPAPVAVVAVEDVVAVLRSVTRTLEPYAGDYSKDAEKHLLRATELLEDAGAELGAANHRLKNKEPM